MKGTRARQDGRVISLSLEVGERCTQDLKMNSKMNLKSTSPTRIGRDRGVKEKFDSRPDQAKI